MMFGMLLIENVRWERWVTGAAIGAISSKPYSVRERHWRSCSLQDQVQIKWTVARRVASRLSAVMASCNTGFIM